MFEFRTRLQLTLSHNSTNNDAVVSSLRQVPKPGYGLAPRSQTFSSATSGSAHGVPVSCFYCSKTNQIPVQFFCYLPTYSYSIGSNFVNIHPYLILYCYLFALLECLFLMYWINATHTC